MDYYQSVPQEQSLPPQQPIPTGLNVNAPPHTVNVNGTGGGLPHEEPMAVPEPVLPVTAVPPEPAPAPVVMNGGISMMAGEDLGGRVAPPSAPVETVQTPLSHSCKILFSLFDKNHNIDSKFLILKRCYISDHKIGIYFSVSFDQIEGFQKNEQILFFATK